jgi:hypothetical protein
MDYYGAYLGGFWGGPIREGTETGNRERERRQNEKRGVTG